MTRAVIQHAFGSHIKNRTALDAFDGRQSAVMRNVGGFRSPRRNRADAGNYQKKLAITRGHERPAIGEKFFQDTMLMRAECLRGLDKMDERTLDRPYTGARRFQ